MTTFFPRNRLASLFLCLLHVCAGFAVASAATVSSPDSRIQVTVEVKKNLDPYPAEERLYYSATFKGKPLLLDSAFRLDFKGMPSIANGLLIKGETRRSMDETWKPVWGTRERIRNRANELEAGDRGGCGPQEKTELHCSRVR